MSIDSFHCTQCPWSASGSGAEDREEEHWRKTHHVIDTVPPAETDWAEVFDVRPLRCMEPDLDGDPTVRQTVRQMAGLSLPPARGDCYPDGTS